MREKDFMENYRTNKLYLRRSMLLLALVFAGLLLAACSQGASEQDPAAAAVESYFQALVAKDSSRLSNLSCSAWEAEAQKELSSFGAVTAELRDLDCTSDTEDEQSALVSCTGVIAANYGNEVLEIDLSGRPVEAVYESDEWRMCGYR